MISAHTSRDMARHARRMRLRRCAQSMLHARRQREVVGSPGASGAVIGSAVIGPAPCSGRVAVAIADPRKECGPRSFGTSAGRYVHDMAGVLYGLREGLAARLPYRPNPLRPNIMPRGCVVLAETQAGPGS